MDLRGGDGRRCSRPAPTGSAAAPTPTASCGSWTRRAPARGAGARWPPAATATRRSVTAASRVTSNFDLTGYRGYGGEHDSACHHVRHRSRRPQRRRPRPLRRLLRRIFGWSVKAAVTATPSSATTTAWCSRSGSRAGDVRDQSAGPAPPVVRGRLARGRARREARVRERGSSSTTTASSPTAKARPAAASSSRTPTASGWRSSPAPACTAPPPSGRPDLRVLLGLCRATTRRARRPEARRGRGPRRGDGGGFETESRRSRPSSWRRSRGSCSARPMRAIACGRRCSTARPASSPRRCRRRVHIARTRSPGDPLDGALNGPVGGLAIEPGTRRRMRLNGQAWHDRRRPLDRARAGLSNCPKYIATRHVECRRDPTPSASRRVPRRGGRGPLAPRTPPSSPPAARTAGSTRPTAAATRASCASSTSTRSSGPTTRATRCSTRSATSRSTPRPA